MQPTGCAKKPRSKAEIEASEKRPRALKVKPQNIPRELRKLDQWVSWKWERRGGKWTKRPFDPKTGHAASSTDPTTWGKFERALDRYGRNEADGIGFVLMPENGLVMVDIDDYIDTNTGDIKPMALAVIAQLDSYTEKSVTGTGVHIILHGYKPDNERSKRGNIEIYDGLTKDGKPGGRFLTFTGHHLERTPERIQLRQDALAHVYYEHVNVKDEPVKNLPALTDTVASDEPVKTLPARTDALANVDDAEIIRMANAAANGNKFARLWSGSTDGYDSPSEAVLALLSILAFWTGPDALRIDRLFRQSGLYRDHWVGKWERLGKAEIEKALAGRTTFYSPRRRHRVRSMPSHFSLARRIRIG
jgi:primase-polymerase (primpol)-like protein